MSDEALRAELVKKAKKAKINVPDEWGVEEIETALGLKALEDAESAPVAAAPPALPEGSVMVRITKAGQGKVYTGLSDGSTYNMDDMVALPLDIAEALEKRAYAEIR